MQQVIEFIASESTAFVAFWVCLAIVPLVNILATKRDKDNELP
jgi:hypothetical protein